MATIHEGDIGTTIRLTITDENDSAVDISSNTTLQIYLRKPDGTTATKTATLTNDGTDGILEWSSTLATDFDQNGSWRAQGHVVITGGTWTSDELAFVVKESYV